MLEDTLVAISVTSWTMFNIIGLLLMAAAGIQLFLILFYILVIVKKIKKIMVVIEVGGLIVQEDAQQVRTLIRRYLKRRFEDACK